MTTDDTTPRDIAPKFTLREWVKAVRTMEGQYKYHTDKANSASFPLLQGYHWEQSMICDRIVKELKRAQIEGGGDE
jgi:hypothetical protein